MNKRKYDWHLLYKEYCLAKMADSAYTIKQFSESKGMRTSYAYMANQFAEIEDHFAQQRLAGARRRLWEVAPKAVDRTERVLDSEDDGNALRAAKIILDASGLTPQGANNQINIQNNVIAPTFVGDADAEDFKKFIGGEP